MEDDSAVERLVAASTQHGRHLLLDAADAVLDVTGGDVNDELLKVRDTVAQVTGVPARPFRQWAAEHAGAFR